MKNLIAIIVLSYLMYVVRCIGGFIKIPKNINSMPIDRSYKALFTMLSQKYNTNNIRLKQVASK